MAINLLPPYFVKNLLGRSQALLYASSLSVFFASAESKIINR